MATIQEITQGSSYVGNAALGGGVVPATELDSKPLDNLALYTMYYNKTKYDQDQKDTDAKIKELADLSQIELNQLRGKDRDQAKTEFAGLTDEITKEARIQPTTSQGKIEQQLRIQLAKRKFMDNYNSGKTRAISYVANIKSVDEDLTLNAAQRDSKIKAINKDFDETDIGTVISSVPKFTTTTTNLPAPLLTKTQAVAVGSNTDFNTDITFLNPKVISSQADAIAMGLRSNYIPKKIKDSNGKEIDNPDYSSLSEKGRLQQDQQNLTLSEAKIWQDSAEVLNSALLSKDGDGNLLYVKNGVFDNKKFEDDNFSNHTIMDPYFSIIKYGKYSDDLATQLSENNSVFSDKGVQYKLRTAVDPTDAKYGHIDLSKGVTANQVVSAGIAAKHPGNTFETKEIQTDNAIQKDAQALQLKIKNIDELNANYRANLPYNKLKEADKAKAGDQQKIADEFGNIIYNVNVDKPISLQQPDGNILNNVKVKQGTLLDKDDNPIDFSGYVRLPTGYFDNSIVTEYDKYVGGVKTDNTGQALTTSTPTKLLKDADGNFIVKMKNGEIDGIKADDGSFVSVDQFRHITLTAGQKGTTKYKKPDTKLGSVGKGSGNPQTQKVDEYGVPIP